MKARHSKTAARRLASIQPNLAAWLQPHRRPAGAVCPQNLRKLLEEDRDRAGLLEDWPQNASRHSFGSYHLAHFKDAAALALQMGNSPDVIFKHYRQLVKPKEAASYWRIAPVRPTQSPSRSRSRRREHLQDRPPASRRCPSGAKHDAKVSSSEPQASHTDHLAVFGFNQLGPGACRGARFYRRRFSQ